MEKMNRIKTKLTWYETVRSLPISDCIPLSDFIAISY